MATKRIGSWKELQAHAPKLLEQLQADQRLALAAAANPLLALDELGYEIAPEVRSDIRDQLRFGARLAAERRQARKAVFREVGQPFDLDDPEELERMLREKLKLALPVRGTGRGRRAGAAALAAPLGLEDADPLESLRGRHPSIEPLLAYRRLEARAPRFASPAAYEAIRRGERRLPITGIRGRLKRRGEEPPDR